MAIAYDNSSSIAVGASPRTLSHTVTGSNPYLLVGAFLPSTTDTVTGITYNGVAMTFIKRETADVGLNTYTTSVWGLANPSTGANNVVVTTSSGTVGIIVWSGTGVLGGLDASNTNVTSTGSSPMTVSVTTVADNCWTVLFCSSGGANPTAGTGSTLRISGTPGGAGLFDSNAALTPAGSKSMDFTYTSSYANGVIVSLSPTAPPVTARPSFLFNFV